jgi:hypothetical protein
MDQQLRKEYREYAWKYFELHAEHRLKAFNFFVVFSTLLTSVFVNLITKNEIKAQYCLLPIALTFFSFLFWRLEERIRMLTKNGETALIHLDKIALENKESPLNLFANDDMATKKLKKNNRIYFSYSQVFHWLYFSTMLSGLLGTIICLSVVFFSTETVHAQIPPPVDIPVQNIPQETQVWCWAAVAQQIIMFSQGPKRTPPQCALVAIANNASPQACCSGYNPMCREREFREFRGREFRGHLT